MTASDCATTELSAGVVAQTYRAEISGLRAIAVVSVIALHAGFTSVSGGFLGVDVFFVISGYVIYKDLLTRLDAGRLSVLAFYGRRVRRTFPLMLLVVLATLAACYATFMPGDYVALAASALAAVLSVSNIFFFTQSGYFDHDSLTKPLLHTWSLGVEEQFYLLIPWAAVLFFKLPPRVHQAMLITLLGAGFTACVLVQSKQPQAAFFLMPLRIWEFMLGAVVVFGPVPALRGSVAAQLVAAIAFVALVASMVIFSDASAHPGFPTLVPCLATAALIHVGGDNRTIVSQFLGNRVFEFVGRISYSLYMWHWPLIVLARYQDRLQGALSYGILFALILVMSYLSCSYVENRFRRASPTLQPYVRPILVSGLVVSIVSASSIIAFRGLPSRFAPAVAEITSFYDYESRRNFREGSCFLTTKFGDFSHFDKQACLKSQSGRPNYLLIGDSEAAHYWVGLARVFKSINVMQATASGCKPTLPARGKSYCVALMRYVFEEVLPKRDIDGILFAAAWEDQDIAGLNEAVAYAKRYVRSVVVLGNIPLHDIPLPTLIGRSLVEGNPRLIDAHQVRYSFALDKNLASNIEGATYVSIMKLLCPEEKCQVLVAQNVPLQFDKSHLTTEGSVFVADRLKSIGLFVTTPKDAQH